VRSSPIAIVVIDLDGRVLLWNPAAERTFGWTSDEVLGEPLPIVGGSIHEEHLERRRELLAGSRAEGRIVQRLRKDGVLVTVRLDTAPIRDASCEVVSFMGLITDITEQQ